MDFIRSHKLIVATIAIQIIALPLILLAVKQQQDTKTQATAGTTLTFNPSSSSTAPIAKNINDPLPLDIMLNPVNDLVSSVKIQVDYDPTKVKLDPNNPVTVNSQSFPVILEGPGVIESGTTGKIIIALGIGADYSKVIQTSTKVMTLNFIAVAPTTTNSQITINSGTTNGRPNTKVTSVASDDGPDENVLITSSLLPAFVKVNSAPTSTPTPSPTNAPSPTPTPVPFRITGKHVDANGNLVNLSGMGVTITNISNNTSQTRTTSSWTFDNLPRTDYRITANPIAGYQIQHMVCYECIDQDQYFSSNTFTLSTTNRDYVGVTFKYTPLPTSTPTPTNLPTPTPIAQATATPTPANTVISFTGMKLHGLGKGGDSPNPTSTGNLNPLRTSRTLKVEIFNTSGTLVNTINGNLTYTGSGTGLFNGQVTLPSSFETGNYTVKITSPFYLTRQLAGFMSIIKGQTNNAPSATLIAGDVNNDNRLTVADYDLIMDCYSDLEAATSCDANKKLAADISDDGNVNQDDYNLFLRELSVQTGD